ncbi:ead/Ea22-like family protein [Escherichia coli]|uniref:ead/Ea22-like family protein n=1 Tax=Escherichia coli TaxID=562 RepID=UPI000FBE6E7E|nr:ead/Ea22-like family protein [Escherichia coli]EED0979997.1 ead/Ea22-like family protein [Escherichia coli]EEQ2761718.1 ead/Ea22-like family protein [Escherichia coli]EER5417572.1 ead/Ea22-like family protein [Escherichia coli]EET3797603.1 ead/Ea22-like family protein [Escherichia coli]EFK9327474.1 ead/Ea22-like family protein [Escherichia coli]
MESNIKGLVSAGHEMASELKAECGAVDMRSVAKLISDLATQLEVQLVRANALSEDQQKAIESIKQADSAVKLAHEKFSALAAENAMLKQRTQQLIDIISNTDNDYCMCGSAMKDHVHSGCGYPTGMFDYYYNQWLESDNKTPATDAFLAEVRAQGVDSAINTVIAMMNHQHPVTSKAIDIMRVHAYQIRKGVQS